MATTGKRLLSGCVGLGVLALLTHDIVVGEFNMHGDSFRRTTHPVEFWLYEAFVAVMGLAALYGAVFGYGKDDRR